MAANEGGVRGAVVVTGASTGIGAACARRLDGLGFRVFAGVRRPEDGAALARQMSPRLTPIIIDVTDEASIAAAVETVSAAVGDAGLAGLVNNAGIAIAAPLEFAPLAEVRRQLEVNTIGLLAVTQAFLPLLRAGHGRILNVGSVSGLVASPFTGPYSASKFALEALTDTLRMELRPWSLHVSIVAPGVVATPIWAKSVAAADRLLQALPREAHELYGAAMDAVRASAMQTAQSGAGIAPEAVARAVVHALTARRPKTRYLVGLDARAGALAAFIPARLRDRLILAAQHIPREARTVHRGSPRQTGTATRWDKTGA